MMRLVSRRAPVRVSQTLFCIACVTLAGCAAGNTGAKLRIDHVQLPTFAAPAAAPALVPPACPAELRAPIPAEPALPDDAYFPRPETADAAAPTARYFTWLHAHEDWARVLSGRVAQAIGYCGAP